MEQHNLNRQMIAENMNVAAHYASSSRPSSTSSASSGHHQISRQTLGTASTSPSPNLPDYTQVSPAKMALRRHLSQEKISQQFGPMNVGSAGDRASMASKTIGDLVNGEIERTLEISNQSIINAAINMSSMLGSHSSTPPSTGAVINISAQRPERVNVRVVEDLMPNQHTPFGQVQKGTYNRVSGREITESPVHLHGQSNLATLAHVAYNQKNINQHGMPGQGAPTAHAQTLPPQPSAMNPLTIQTISPRASSQFSPASAASLRYQQTPPSPHTPRGSSSTVSRQSEHIVTVQHPAQPKYMPLPRADMKPHLESYFAEQKQQKQLSHAKMPVEEKRRNNIPLEGTSSRLRFASIRFQFSSISCLQVWRQRSRHALWLASMRTMANDRNEMTSTRIRRCKMAI